MPPAPDQPDLPGEREGKPQGPLQPWRPSTSPGLCEGGITEEEVRAQRGLKSPSWVRQSRLCKGCHSKQGRGRSNKWPPAHTLGGEAARCPLYTGSRSSIYFSKSKKGHSCNHRKMTKRQRVLNPEEQAYLWLWDFWLHSSVLPTPPHPPSRTTVISEGLSLSKMTHSSKDFLGLEGLLVLLMRKTESGDPERAQLTGLLSPCPTSDF